MAYTYNIRISSGIYQIWNGSSLIYSNSSFSNIFNYLLGSSGIAQNGETVYIESGNYIVDSSCLIYKNSIILTLSPWTQVTNGNGFHEASGGAILTAVANLNNNMLAVYGTNVIINGGTFDGNGHNQSASNYNFGLRSCNNSVLFMNVAVHNVRCFGVVTGGSGFPNGINNWGVMNCLIYDCGWNCIVTSNASNSYIINNEVWGCSDVAINIFSSSGLYDSNAIVTGNYIHHLNYATMPGYGGTIQGDWGIGVEGGGGTGSGNYALIANNDISGAIFGIVLTDTEGVANNYILITGNYIHDLSQSWSPGIDLISNASYNILSYNTISAPQPIYITNTNCVNNNVYGNSGGIYNNGYGTTFNLPSLVAVTVTSSPLGNNFVTANGSAGKAGTLSSSPYTFYSTVGTSISISTVANGYTFTGWSDGGAQTHNITVQYGYSTNVYTANFIIGVTNYTINASSGANGTINPSGAVVVSQGANQTFNITPSSGYAISMVTVDGSTIGAYSSYTFNNVQSNHSISVTFVIIQDYTSFPFTESFGNLSHWHILDGTWDIVSQGVQASGTAEELLYGGQSNWNNYFVLLTTTIVVGGESSIVMYYTDSTHYYWIGLGMWGHQYSIGLYNGSSISELKSVGSSTDNGTGMYTIKATIDNSGVISLYVNTNLVLQTTDTTLTSGKIGLRTFNNTTIFNNLYANSNYSPTPHSKTSTDYLGYVDFNLFNKRKYKIHSNIDKVGDKDTLSKLKHKFRAVTDKIGNLDILYKIRRKNKYFIEYLSARAEGAIGIFDSDIFDSNIFDEKNYLIKIKSAYKTATDSVGKLDTLLHQRIGGITPYIRTVIEYLGILDSRSKYKNKFHIITDMEGLKDTNSKIKRSIQYITEILSNLDSTLHSKVRQKIYTELLGYKDTRAKFKNKVHTAIENITTRCESLFDLAIFDSNVFDTEIFLIKVKSAYRNFNDLISELDTLIAPFKTKLRFITESLGTNESYSKLKTAIKSLNSYIGNLDSFIKVRKAYHSLNELEGLYDARTKTKRTLHIYTDKIGNLDAIVKSKNIIKSKLDYIGNKDTISKLKTKVKTVTDQIGNLDLLNRLFDEIQHISVFITEYLGAISSDTKNKLSLKTVTDLIGALDINTKIRMAIKNITDYIGGLDSRTSTQLRQMYHIINEYLSGYDYPIITGKLKVVLENLGFNDNINKFKTLLRSFNESIGNFGFINRIIKHRKLILETFNEKIGLKDRVTHSKEGTIWVIFERVKRIIGKLITIIEKAFPPI